MTFFDRNIRPSGTFTGRLRWLSVMVAFLRFVNAQRSKEALGVGECTRPERSSVTCGDYQLECGFRIGEGQAAGRESPLQRARGPPISLRFHPASGFGVYEDAVPQDRELLLCVRPQTQSS